MLETRHHLAAIMFTKYNHHKEIHKTSMLKIKIKNLLFIKIKTHVFKFLRLYFLSTIVLQMATLRKMMV